MARLCAQYDDAEAEGAALPDLLEDQLAVEARQRRSYAERVVDIGESGGCTHGSVFSATGTATPIIASRVTIAASASSSQPSVPEGRSGAPGSAPRQSSPRPGSWSSAGSSRPNSRSTACGSETIRARYGALLYQLGGSPSTGHG